MVQLPDRLPAVRWLIILWALYGIVWIGLEGAMGQVLVMGVGAALVVGGQGLVRHGGKRPYPLHHFLLLSSFYGLLAGFLAAPLTLFFMLLKTGLHAHGPEFTPPEIAWTFQQIPLWSIVGLLLGFGVGLLLAARFSSSSH